MINISALVMVKVKKNMSCKYTSTSIIAHSCTRFPCHLGMEDNQCRDPMNNNKDCRVGQLTTSIMINLKWVAELRNTFITITVLD